MPPYSHAAFLSYQRFLLANYQLDVEGLFLLHDQFYIHYPAFTTESVTAQGENLAHWFEEHKDLGVPITITATVPHGAIRLDLDQFQDIMGDSPKLLVQKDVHMEAQLLVPKGFPDFQVTSGHNGTVTLTFAQPVSDESTHLLKKIFEQQRFLYPIKIAHGPLLEEKPKPLPDVFAYLSTYRELKGKMGRSLANVMEQDEDLWLEKRTTLLKSPIRNDSSTNNKGLSCLVDGSVFAPENIRNYLSIYDRVGIILPFEAHFKGFLHALGATETELQELAALDRIELFAPKSLAQYPLSFIDKIAEARPANVHLSRSITARMINEVRRRNPLFYPAVGLDGQKLLLREMQEAINTLPSQIRPTAAKSLSDLGQHWITIPSSINQHDYSRFSGVGIVNLLAAIIQFYTKEDRWLEFHMAAAPVEIAAAFDSVVIPPETDRASMAPYYETISEFYSGVPDKEIMPRPGYANFAIKELLVVSQLVPIVEFAKTFTGAEVKRFRNIITGMARHHQTPEDLEATIGAFNHFVKQYEKSKLRRNIWSLSGYLLSSLGKTTGIPLGNYLLKYLAKEGRKRADKNPQIATILDQLEATLVGNFPDAIFVSKMKTKLKNKI